MKVKYKIGTDSEGNYKVRFMYKYDSGVAVQETHHLPYPADAENAGRVCAYTNLYMNSLRSRLRQDTKGKEKAAEVIQHGEKRDQHGDNKNRRFVQGERKAEAHG